MSHKHLSVLLVVLLFICGITYFLSKLLTISSLQNILTHASGILRQQSHIPHRMGFMWLSVTHWPFEYVHKCILPYMSCHNNCKICIFWRNYCAVVVRHKNHTVSFSTAGSWCFVCRMSCLTVLIYTYFYSLTCWFKPEQVLRNFTVGERNGADMIGADFDIWRSSLYHLQLQFRQHCKIFYNLTSTNHIFFWCNGNSCIFAIISVFFVLSVW